MKDKTLPQILRNVLARNLQALQHCLNQGCPPDHVAVEFLFNERDNLKRKMKALKWL